MNFDEFLQQEGYTVAALKKSGLTKSVLNNIFDDYKNNKRPFVHTSALVL